MNEIEIERRARELLVSQLFARGAVRTARALQDGQDGFIRTEDAEGAIIAALSVAPAPAAVPVELAKFRNAVLHAYGIATDARFEKQLGELLDLIESRFQKEKQEVFVCTGDEIRCHDGNGCKCAMRGLMNK